MSGEEKRRGRGHGFKNLHGGRGRGGVLDAKALEFLVISVASDQRNGGGGMST